MRLRESESSTIVLKSLSLNIQVTTDFKFDCSEKLSPLARDSGAIGFIHLS